MNYSYSATIVNQVSTYLRNNDWNFTFDEKKGLFRFSLRIRNKLRSIDYSIKTPGLILKRYGNGLVDVIFSQASPKQAVEACERGNAAVIRSYMNQLVQNDNPDQDLIARLAACLESMPGGSNDDMHSRL